MGRMPGRTNPRIHPVNPVYPVEYFFPNYPNISEHKRTYPNISPHRPPLAIRNPQSTIHNPQLNDPSTLVLVLRGLTRCDSPGPPVGPPFTSAFSLAHDPAQPQPAWPFAILPSAIPLLCRPPALPRRNAAKAGSRNTEHAPRNT